MFNVRRPKQKPIVVIRAATGNELSNYEKRKLATIEEKAQENKIESISLSIGENKQLITPIDKEVDIKLGSLAAKSTITDVDLSKDELFFIKCELDESITDVQN